MNVNMMTDMNNNKAANHHSNYNAVTNRYLRH